MVHLTFSVVHIRCNLPLPESSFKLIVKLKFGVNQASSELQKQSIGTGLKIYGSNRER